MNNILGLVMGAWGVSIVVFIMLFYWVSISSKENNGDYFIELLEQKDKTDYYSKIVEQQQRKIEKLEKFIPNKALVEIYKQEIKDSEEFLIKSKASCKHKKVFAPFVLSSSPPQYLWICSECGEEGIDMSKSIGKNSNEYEELKRIKKEQKLLQNTQSKK